MHSLRPFIILSWLALPTVMFGGFSLLNLLTRTNRLSTFQQTYFRAGHAHAGVLLLMSLLYDTFIDQTTFPSAGKVVLAIAFLVGVLAQSGGFFLHMLVGKQGEWSPGNTLTATGAVLLAVSILILVIGLITL
jgi:drug/metabolite transporter superfamily protein YnfA